MLVIGYFLAALVGVSLGLIGGGGSILTLPILVYVFKIDPVTATSYSLFIVGFTSLIGVIINKDFVKMKIALLFGSSSIITVLLTRSIIMPQVPKILFSIGKFDLTQAMATMMLFAVIMLLSSISMIKNTAPEIKTNSTVKGKVDIVKIIGYGILIGLITGFLGAGGGFLLIPALVILLKMPMKNAISTSLLIIAFNSLIGFLGDIGHFSIKWNLLISIALVAIAGILVGGFLAKKIEGYQLKKAFGWFVFVMGIVIICTQVFQLA